MRFILSIVALLAILSCLPIGLINLSNDNFLIGAALLIWFSLLLPACVDDIKQSLPKVKKCFSMIELIAVITIVSILLTVTMRAMKTDPSQADITRIGGELKLLQNEARGKREVKQFMLANDYFSNVTMSHDNLFFNEQGEPTDIDGNQIVGFYIQAHDTRSNPVKVFIRPFTGKVTFLEL